MTVHAQPLTPAGSAAGAAGTGDAEYAAAARWAASLPHAGASRAAGTGPGSGPAAAHTALLVAGVERYLALGWKLFVLSAGPGGRKTPAANCTACDTAGPGHDMEACDCLLCHGFYAATSDPARLAAMFGQVRGGTLAVRTGRASGITVIDAESTAQGAGLPTGVAVLDGWAAWSGGWDLPDTATALTRSGGVHLFYATGTGPEGEVRSRARVLPSVDVKGDGGYVALPPGFEGERRWLTGADPAGPLPGEVAEPGKDLLEWLRTVPGKGAGGRRGQGSDGTGPGGSGPGAGAVRGEDYDFELFRRDGAPRGYQSEYLNDRLFRLIRHTGLSDAGALFAEVWPEVEGWDQDAADPWTERRVRAKVDSMVRTTPPAEPLPVWRRAVEAADGTVRGGFFLNGPAGGPEEPEGAEGAGEGGEAPAKPATGAAEDAADAGGAGLPPGSEDAPEGAPESSAAPAVPEPGDGEEDEEDEDSGTGAAEESGTGTVIPVDFGRGGSGKGSTGGEGPGGGSGGGGGTGGGAAGYAGDRREALDDSGNAHRFARLHAADVRYVADLGTWLVWNGVRWVRDRTGRVLDMTLSVSADLEREAEEAAASEEADRWLSWASKSRSWNARRAMLKLAAAVPSLAVTADMLDADPWTLVVGNGVLDLRTGAFKEPDPAALCTLSAAVDFDPGAVCPKWERHVEFAVQGDAELAAYLQRLAGYTLTGSTAEQAFFSLEGSGANGKNVFVEPLMSVLGEYATVASSKLLTQGDKSHAAIVADLVGARMVFVDEIPQGRPVDVERIKSLTGSAKMKAQFMRQDWFAFTPQMKVWIAGNDQPRFKDSSDGVWRRMKRVLFTGKMAEEDKILDYSRVLFEEEGAGILNWMLAGLADWRGRGSLGTPAGVALAVAELKEDEDHVAAFLGACVRVTGRTAAEAGHWATSAQVYQVYSAWCDANGVPGRERLNGIHLGRRVAALEGVERFKDHRTGTGGQERGVAGLVMVATAAGIVLGSVDAPGVRRA